MWILTLLPADATGVVSFRLGASSRPGVFVEPPTMHGAHAFDRIQVSFGAKVHVDFYDLELQAVAADGCEIPLALFSHDPVAHTAEWGVTGQSPVQNARFRLLVSGVWDEQGQPIDPETCSAEFTILTGDVTGDDWVSSLDFLAITNHINAGLPYDPAMDVNWDGVVSPLDILMINSILNTSGAQELVAPGEFVPRPLTPPAALRISDIIVGPTSTLLVFDGLPAGSRLLVQAATGLSFMRWQPILDVFVEAGVNQATIRRLPDTPREFYRATFR
jgi:hypothetical protein